MKSTKKDNLNTLHGNDNNISIANLFLSFRSSHSITSGHIHSLKDSYTLNLGLAR